MPPRTCVMHEVSKLDKICKVYIILLLLLYLCNLHTHIYIYIYTLHIHFYFTFLLSISDRCFLSLFEFSSPLLMTSLPIITSTTHPSQGCITPLLSPFHCSFYMCFKRVSYYSLRQYICNMFLCF